MQDQAEALAKSGVNVSVVGAIPISFKCIFKNRFLKFGAFEYEKNGVKVRLFLYPSIPKLKFLNQLVRAKINKRLLTNHNNEQKIDAIHVHNSTAANAALFMKQKFDIPYVVTEHSTAYARGLVSQKEVKSYEPVYQNASYRIAVSKEFCKMLQDIFQLEFNYVPNVVNTEYFVPIKKEKEQLFKFINIGYLDTKKNQILLIKAFAKAFSGNENIKLSILGGGPEHQNLQKEITNLNMQEQIKLFGFAKREKVLEELQNSDAFVLSSKYETFGVVVIEAMSCGLPVIATKCGGPESIVESEYLGVLIENDNLEGLLNAMQTMYKNREIYSVENIREYVVDNFSQQAIAEKILKIYKSIKNKEVLKFRQLEK